VYLYKNHFNKEKLKSFINNNVNAINMISIYNNGDLDYKLFKCIMQNNYKIYIYIYPKAFYILLNRMNREMIMTIID